MVWTVEHAAIFSLCRETKPVINVLMEDDWLAGFFISFVVSFVQENILPFEKFIILYRPIWENHIFIQSFWNIVKMEFRLVPVNHNALSKHLQWKSNHL